jgi:hypothetical protein
MTEAVRTSEASVYSEPTRRYIPKGFHRHLYQLSFTWEILDSHGGNYDDDSLLGYRIM